LRESCTLARSLVSAAGLIVVYAQAFTWPKPDTIRLQPRIPRAGITPVTCYGAGP